MNLGTFFTQIQQDWPTRTVLQPPRAPSLVASGPLAAVYRIADSISLPFATIEPSEVFTRDTNVFENYRSFGGNEILMFLVRTDADEASPVYAWDHESQTPVEEWEHDSVEAMLFDLYKDFIESSTPCRMCVTKSDPAANASLISAFRKLTNANLSEAKARVTHLPLKIETTVQAAFPLLSILRGVGCIVFLEKDF